MVFYIYREFDSQWPCGNDVKTELHVLRKGQQMWVPSLNDLATDGTLNTTHQPAILHRHFCSMSSDPSGNHIDVDEKDYYL